MHHVPSHIISTRHLVQSNSSLPVAPSESAFASLPLGVLDKLLLPENKDSLMQVLLHHVVEGSVMSGDLTAELLWRPLLPRKLFHYQIL